MQELVKKHATKFRFALVGGANTAIDFGLLVILSSFLGVPRILANTISTAVSFVFSFFANKKYTFRSTKQANIKKQMLWFTLVTLFGLWVIQNIIIALVAPFLINLGASADASLIFGKMMATLASLIWNYILYSRVVFRD
ncbi:GtrA family protein [Candidatus Saccharibacteria bacterium]|nr:GtrA family protein [Candidatus Saccharibacteria bacterium]